jgi:hypothetical protein
VKIVEVMLTFSDIFHPFCMEVLAGPWRPLQRRHPIRSMRTSHFPKVAARLSDVYRILRNTSSSGSAAR